MSPNCDILAAEDFVLAHIQRENVQDMYNQLTFLDFVRSHPQLRFVKFIFWPRFYIMVLGIVFFHSLTFHVLFGLWNLFSIWTFLFRFFFSVPFQFHFSSISVQFQFFFNFKKKIFYRCHIVDFFQFFFLNLYLKIFLIASLGTMPIV